MDLERFKNTCADKAQDLKGICIDKARDVKDFCVDKARDLKDFLKHQTCHEYILPEGNSLMEQAVSELISQYAGRGLYLQEFSFRDGSDSGILLQIRNESGSMSNDLLKVLGGQLLSVCVRFLATKDGLRIQIKQGRWLDKMISGSLSWSIFPPLLALPIWGGWKQKKLMEQVEHDLLAWLEEQPGGIAVSLDL